MKSLKPMRIWDYIVKYGRISTTKTMPILMKKDLKPWVYNYSTSQLTPRVNRRGGGAAITLIRDKPY